MQKGVARRLDVEPWDQVVASVRAKSDDAVHVAAENGAVFPARRALSCLTDPEPGDQVLVLRSRQTAEAYVLAVLERRGDARVALVSPRDTELRSAGALSIVARETTLVSPTLSVHSTLTRLHAASVTAVLGTVDAIVDRVVQRAKQVFRVVEQLDHLRVGHADYEAKGTMSLHGANTTLTAEGLVKVDGEQIQLG